MSMSFVGVTESHNQMTLTTSTRGTCINGFWPCFGLLQWDEVLSIITYNHSVDILYLSTSSCLHLAEVEYRHTVESCFTSHNKWLMFGSRLTPRGNIQLSYLQCSPVISDNVVWQIGLCSSVVCRAEKCEVVGANDNAFCCFEHTEWSFHQFLIKNIDSDSNGGIFTLIQAIFNNSKLNWTWIKWSHCGSMCFCTHRLYCQ